jgi:hypothetical protein
MVVAAAILHMARQGVVLRISVSRRMRWQTALLLQAGVGVAQTTAMRVRQEVLAVTLRGMLPYHQALVPIILVAVVGALRLVVRRVPHQP